MMNRILILGLLIGFAALMGKGWHWAKDGFQINRVFYKTPLLLAPASLSADDRSAEIEEALAQTFRYLGRGHQCYAFGSDDGKYVVKLPRYDRYDLSFFLRSFSWSGLDLIREKTEADLTHRLEFLLESFRLAAGELREDTGVIALHLQPTASIRQQLRLRDRLGRTYILDSNRTPFILQEKKEILMAAFLQKLKAGERAEAERILDAFLGVVARRAEKGICNKDPSFVRNYGWDGQKGFQIDIGSYYKKEGFESSFRNTLDPVVKWLAKLDPEMGRRFQGKIEGIVEEKKGL